MKKKTKTLDDSMKIVKFYETSRIFFNQHRSQLMDDYELEMVRRSKEHRMDFEEYCLSVLFLMFRDNPHVRTEDKLFENESHDLLLYYQLNKKSLKKTWDKNCDDTLFEWTLTSYDRYKADNRSGILLSDIFKNK